MKCINCETEARAVCQFCGRAVCKQHIQEGRYASGFTARGEPGFKSFNLSWSSNGVVVEDAVWCGVCHPEFSMTK